MNDVLMEMLPFLMILLIEKIGCVTPVSYNNSVEESVLGHKPEMLVTPSS